MSSSADQSATALPSSDAAFPYFRFAGSHHEIGRQYGESCLELIHRHVELAVNRLENRVGIPAEIAYQRALAFQDSVSEYASYFSDEIEGMAEGANLTLAQAYLLQLRAEVATPGPWTDAVAEANDECTTFAILPEATANGIGLVGQNADLPAFYKEIAIVAEMRPDDLPTTLMLLPAGQISYIGINDRGMGCFANFLTCDGWRIGFPRYFFSRLALTKETVSDGIEAIRGVKRASSRNLMMLDSHGGAADLETTPTRDARIDPVDGLLAHANHYTAPELLDEERSPETYLGNTRTRQTRMEELLRDHRGQHTAEGMQAILRDRTCYPDALCRERGDSETSDTITFASVIAEPSEGALWVAVGPPNQHEYIRHSIERVA
jgi:hypothetical protein